MTEILLNTKVGVPSLRSVTVIRDHLFAYLDGDLLHAGEFQRKLTLVSAPAGYGKTTLVAEWLRAAGLPVAWLSLDEADNDPNRFMAYLIAAVQSIHAGFGEAARAMIQAPQGLPMEVALTVMLNEIKLLSPSFFLVLDDYHTINQLSIHRAISFILEHLPACCHLVLITREDPLIPIARLRAGNQVLEVRQNNLRFSADEITEFMSRVMQLSLSPGDILALERRTEGWIAGLQLAALSLHGSKDKDAFIQAFTGSNRYILDYLIEEVFTRQSIEVQDFLLKTSILDRFCGPLCDAIMERTGSRELLERLELANMFIIPLEQTRTWYRYHRLFAELLQHQQNLARQPVNIVSLHQRASQWFEAEGYLADAIDQSLTAQDWEKAAKQIGQLGGKMFTQGEIITLIGWLEKLPGELILAQPDLCLNYAWALLLVGKYDLAKPVVEQAEKLAQPGSAFLGQVATAKAYLARSVGDNPGVIKTSRVALELLPEEDIANQSNVLMNLGLAYWHEGRLDEAAPTLVEAQEKAVQCGNLYAQLTSEIFLARTEASRGKIQDAALKYSEILRRGSQVPILALAYFDLGAIYYEWNELDKAELYLQPGLEMSLRNRNVEFQILGLFLQTSILLARRDWNGASKTAEQACTLGKEFSPRTQGRCAACKARVAMAMGDLKSAAHWLEQSPLDVDSHPFYRFLSLNPARLLIAQGRIDSAAELLRTCYEMASQAGWGYALIAVRVLQALAADNPVPASEFMKEALQLAQPEGYLRTFIEAGNGLIPLLSNAAQQGITPEYAGQILANLGAEIKIPTKLSQDLVEPLSEREIEVLRLVAAGLSNREIAGRLFISPGTAKTHIHNLCGKLGVRNRTEAATRAKELGLA